MKAFFAASSSRSLEYYDAYNTVRKTLAEEDVKITRDWFPEVVKTLKSGNNKPENIPNFYHRVLEAITMADVLVAEVTSKAFSVSNQITFALLKKKPVLLLCHVDSKSPIFDLLKEVHSDLLTIFFYENLQDIPQQIKKFINMHRKGKKVRLNLAIESTRNNYLEWVSQKYGKNKTEILINLIDDKMKNDFEYQRHINN